MAKKSQHNKISPTQPDSASPSPTQLSRWLHYLDIYNNQHDKFKFSKNIQYQLIKYTYNKLLLPKQYFTLYLNYLSNIQGKSKQLLIDTAQNHIDVFENNKYEEKDQHEARRNYKRAKQIIDVLVK